MKNGRVALLESEPLHVRLLLYNLQRKGYEVECYEDEQSFLASLQNESFDACIISVQLDKTNGLQIGERIRACGIDTPILFLSTGDEEAYAVSLTHTEIIKKPFQVADLLEKLEQITSFRSSVSSVIQKI